MGLVVSTSPCPTCGSLALFLDETPECVPCFAARDKASVGTELVIRGFAQILEVARDLPPAACEQLRINVAIWRTELELIAHALADR